MLKKFERYHGSVFSRLLHRAGRAVRIETHSSSSNPSYIIDEHIGLFIKYRTNRMSPWVFSFSQDNVIELLDMRDKLSLVFLALVCHYDGIVCMSYDEFDILINPLKNNGGWIRIERGSREKYAVTGSDGELPGKIGEIEFPSKMLMRASAN